ncbi:MAG: metal ABC transporter permease [Oscillospiraceae bacterium]|nr:metal ABC transporter permease [Oscillospiraceae bacterium]
MSEVFERLQQYFGMPFVQHAMVVGVLIAFCSSLLGVTLVLKRLSFIGSGLSHVSFGTTTIVAAAAMILGIEQFNNNIFYVLPVTILCSVMLLLSGPNSKIKGDSALAMISVGALAVGYLVMNVFSESANLAGDVCTVLFGSTAILTLKPETVWICVILSILVTVLFLLFYNKIFAITFDEDFASATGIKAKIYNLILAVIIAIIIVLAMNLVGALLVSALVVFPALTAMRVFKSFKAVTICSVIVSVVCAALGIVISMVPEKGTPIGSTIVAVDIAVFIIFGLIGFIMRKGVKV